VFARGRGLGPAGMFKHITSTTRIRSMQNYFPEGLPYTTYVQGVPDRECEPDTVRVWSGACTQPNYESLESGRQHVWVVAAIFMAIAVGVHDGKGLAHSPRIRKYTISGLDSAGSFKHNFRETCTEHEKRRKDSSKAGVARIPNYVQELPGHECEPDTVSVWNGECPQPNYDSLEIGRQYVSMQYASRLAPQSGERLGDHSCKSVRPACLNSFHDTCTEHGKRLPLERLVGHKQCVDATVWKHLMEKGDMHLTDRRCRKMHQ
jgi:hypothetical protein